jgi:hypothetical protein
MATRLPQVISKLEMETGGSSDATESSYLLHVPHKPGTQNRG